MATTLGKVQPGRRVRFADGDVGVVENQGRAGTWVRLQSKEQKAARRFQTADGKTVVIGSSRRSYRIPIDPRTEVTLLRKGGEA